MNLPVIHTGGKALLLKFQIQVSKPLNLLCTGYKFGSNVCYFSRIIQIDSPGNYVLEFPMPFTPEQLKICFSNDTNRDETAYKITAISTDYLPQADVWLDKTELEFFEFLKWFTQNSAELPAGSYRSITGKFYINYMDKIIDEVDGEISTPARTDHESGEIQVNRLKLQAMTVPEQMVVLEHERKHYKDDIPKEGATAEENLDAEIACDLEALRICLGYGFPKSECLHAFTNIFEDTPANIKRINIINDYIEKFQYKQQAA